MDAAPRTAPRETRGAAAFRPEPAAVAAPARDLIREHVGERASNRRATEEPRTMNPSRIVWALLSAVLVAMLVVDFVWVISTALSVS